MTTNKLDGELIKQDTNSFVNKDNISNFKTIIIRLILSDAFIKACSIKYDYGDEIEEKNIEYDEENKDYVETELIFINEVYDFINNLTNIYLPNDEDLRFDIYSLFLEYNSDDKHYDLNNFQTNKENIKKVKKLNPLYILDTYKYNK